MGQQEKHNNNVKKTIETIIGADTILKKRKKTESDINREKFTLIINTLEEINIRSSLLENDFKIGISNYDDAFYLIIDSLLEMFFSKESLELIDFYLYKRIDENGNINQLVDKNGNFIALDNPNDLWNLVNPLKK